MSFANIGNVPLQVVLYVLGGGLCRLVRGTRIIIHHAGALVYGAWYKHFALEWVGVDCTALAQPQTLPSKLLRMQALSSWRLVA